jgi:enoyl-CoA hydratase/carnithine racemase
VNERVTCRIDAGVADVRLNRPDKLNAVDAAMFEALGETGDSLASDSAVRAVVLSGEGRGFCAGIDVSVFAGGGGPAAGGDLLGGRGAGGRIANRAQHAAWVWHELPVPVIAAVHGVALGAGLQIALGADLRLVAPDARLSVLEIRWGLIPDMTGTWTLPRAVGLDMAKEMTWTGRMVSGDEAVRLGLATRVCEEPRADAMALAADLAQRSPQALRAAKSLLNQSLGAVATDQLRAESAAIGAIIGSDEQAEAVQAQLEGRRPSFAPGPAHGEEPPPG